MTIDHYELALTAFGLAALLAAWLPAYTERRAMSLPVVLVALGFVLFALPIGLGDVDPRAHIDLTERLTELVVIVSLMGAGLKIDRPFAWRTWRNTWRMVLVAMPVTIALTALAGAVIGGLGGISALLLGGVLAPTDPVLASDVQVGEPTLDDDAAPYAEDEVRFTLTSEAGLNDAMAFPFVYLAIRLAEHGVDGGDTLWRFVAWDLVGRIAIGLVVGAACGWLLGRVSFTPPGRLTALASTAQGFVSIAATLLAYGVTELCSGYGFLAVFVTAVVLRSSERRHEFHGALHRFSEQVENLLVVGLLLVFGGSLTSGLLDGLTWTGAVVAVLLVFVVRPLSGMLALAGAGLSPAERWAAAFFGIRGFGSVYYLAYATGTTQFAETDRLWAIVGLTMVLSIATHGITATPIMNLVDRTVRRQARLDRARARLRRSGAGGDERPMVL